MKNLLYYFILSLLILSCKKKPVWDTSRTYVVQGYIVSSSDKSVVQYQSISISQDNNQYATTDASGTTDSSGYFKIEYTPTGDDKFISIYQKKPDYSCVFHSLFILKNIPKGQDVNLGKIYTNSY